MSDVQRKPQAVVWDVGRVLYHWELRLLFAKLIDDRQQLDWFLANVITEDWHYQHDAGRSLAEMVPERKKLFPQYANLIDAYALRFNETIPGPVERTHDLVARLAANGVRQYALTNFGAEFWAMFRPTAPIFDCMEDAVVSGIEKCAKPDTRIYRILEQRSGMEGADLFFIDDREDNIAAARARGWGGHVFNDADALETELRALELLP